MLDPSYHKRCLLIEALAHDDAVFGEERIRISILEQFADDDSNRIGLVLEVPKGVLLLGEEAENPLQLLASNN